MKTLILDLETDGLMDTVSKIHCAVSFCIETKEFKTYEPHQICSLVNDLKAADVLVCHNGIGFDLKVLKKVLNYNYLGLYRDTLLMARILWPDLEPAEYMNSDGIIKKTKGAHSLEAWGVRFDVAKPVHEDWSKYTPEMLHRCKEDVKITALLYDKIQESVRNSQTENDFIRLDNAITMEHKVWSIIEAQADYGWLFDLESAYTLIEQLNTIAVEIQDKLLPNLPITVIGHPKESKAFTANGKHSELTKRYFGDNKVRAVMGDYTKVKFEQFNIGSDKQVKDYLLNHGWKPAEWNVKKDKHGKPVKNKYNKPELTSPKLPKTAEDWDDVAQAVGNDNIKLIADYNKACHRRSQIEGLVSRVRMDHRIEAQAITCATNCVVAGTLITTDSGSLPIEKIQRGDLILTHTGAYKPCEDFITNGIRSVFRIRLDDGKELTCTENHPLHTEKGFICMKDLKIGDSVTTFGARLEWKKYPRGDYFISNNGDVLNSKGHVLGVKDLACERRRPLYERGQLDLYVDGTYTKKRTGNIILETFVGLRKDKLECCHKDGNPTNNNIDNLYWGTSKENTADALKHGRLLLSQRESKYTKLNQSQVDEIRIRWESEEYYRGMFKEMGAKFGVSSGLVSQICRGERWKRRTETIKNYYKVPFQSTEIKSIEYIGEQPTYDITVNVDHSYVANGIVCHNTSRMVHRQIVNIPKNDPTVFYGKEMRSLFIVEKGKILVGCDASALEARCEAHYVYPYDPIAAMEIIEGDIHTSNAKIFGVTRNVAKSGKYAILYGCSQTKLASTLGQPLGLAKELYENYWDGNPGLKELKAKLEDDFMRWGYLIGIDGRPLTIRYKHALLNSLLQSCGSIAMKYALCIFVHSMNKAGYPFDLVGNFHDEIVLETLPAYADKSGELCVQSIKQAGEMLKLNVALDGEYKIGPSWAETH